MTIANQNDEASPPVLEGKHIGMVYCWILGIGTLISWNCITTIGDYYYKLFPKYYPERALTLLYMFFSVVPLGVLAYYESRIDTRKRNLAGLTIFFLSISLLLVLDLATGGKGGIFPYICACLICSLLGVGEALFQGGMVGDLSLMCSEFLQSYVAGIAASGVITSVLRLFSKAIFEKSPNGLRKGVISFFVISMILELVCLFVYAVFFPKLPIVKYYRSKASSEGSKTVLGDLAAGGVRENQKEGEHQKLLTKKQLLIQNVDYAIDNFLIFALSLSIFPGFLYENTGSHHLGSWYPLVLITMYNVCNLIARCITLVDNLKLKSRKLLTVGVLSRFLLIPAFYFTTKYGDQGWMIFLTSVLGFTEGYLYVCSLAEAPKGYKGPEQNALGNMLVFWGLAGVLAGGALDWLWLLA